VLLNRDVDAGVTRISWDGADEDGRPLAAGIYLLRLEHPGGRETLRVARTP
jgi:hypothetical protein